MAKPRPIGNKAKQDLMDIDLELAASDRFLDPIIEGQKMLQSEASLRATLASRSIRQARLRIANILTYDASPVGAASAISPVVPTHPTNS